MARRLSSTIALDLIGLRDTARSGIEDFVKGYLALIWGAGITAAVMMFNSSRLSARAGLIQPAQRRFALIKGLIDGGHRLRAGL